MGVLGMMAGGGRALGQLADVQLVKNHEAEKDAARQAAELEKEKRIAEQNKQLKSEENQYKIDAETRAAERTKQERQDTFNFNTDPANAEKVAQSKLVTQAAEDKYGDSRFPTKLEQEKQLFDTKDRTDYIGRKLDNDLKQLKLNTETADNKDWSPKDKVIIKSLQDSLALQTKTLASMEQGTPEYIDAEQQAQETAAALKVHITKIGGYQNAQGKAVDPLKFSAEDQAKQYLPKQAPQTDGILSKYADKAAINASELGGKAVDYIKAAFDTSDAPDARSLAQAKDYLSRSSFNTSGLSEGKRLLINDIEDIKRMKIPDNEKIALLARKIKSNNYD